MSDYEMRVIEFESARNEAMDRFYAARPSLVREQNCEFYFEAGFRMAWELLKREAEAITRGDKT
jgi:hypothetical protein